MIAWVAGVWVVMTPVPKTSPLCVTWRGVVISWVIVSSKLATNGRIWWNISDHESHKRKFQNQYLVVVGQRHYKRWWCYLGVRTLSTISGSCSITTHRLSSSYFIFHFIFLFSLFIRSNDNVWVFNVSRNKSYNRLFQCRRESLIKRPHSVSFVCCVLYVCVCHDELDFTQNSFFWKWGVKNWSKISPSLLSKKQTMCVYTF